MSHLTHEQTAQIEQGLRERERTLLPASSGNAVVLMCSPSCRVSSAANAAEAG